MMSAASRMMKGTPNTLVTCEYTKAWPSFSSRRWTKNSWQTVGLRTRTCPAPSATRSPRRKVPGQSRSRTVTHTSVS
jgi:hypothetical protein